MKKMILILLLACFEIFSYSKASDDSYYFSMIFSHNFWKDDGFNDDDSILSKIYIPLRDPYGGCYSDICISRADSNIFFMWDYNNVTVDYETEFYIDEIDVCCNFCELTPFEFVQKHIQSYFDANLVNLSKEQLDTLFNTLEKKWLIR